MPLFDADLRALMTALDKSRARIEFGPDGTVRTANANFLNLMGYTLAEVEGRHHTLFVPPPSGTAMPTTPSGKPCAGASRRR